MANTERSSVDLEQLKMKAATLVSRCSEKDLHDLIWLIQNEANALDIKRLIALGQEIDAGVSGESMLLSLSGAILREESCGFFLSGGEKTSRQIFRDIMDFRQKLIQALHLHEKAKAVGSDSAGLLKELVSRVKKTN